jgi:hypothetical protein
MSDVRYDVPAFPLSPAAVAALVMSAAAVFYLGIYPTTVINVALSSIDTIF